MRQNFPRRSDFESLLSVTHIHMRYVVLILEAMQGQYLIGVRSLRARVGIDQDFGLRRHSFW